MIPKPELTIHIEALPDAERDCAVYGRREPSWSTVCVYAAVVAAGVAAAILILWPVR